MLAIIGWGLSPRARGNLTRNASARFSRRSIPACAGEPPALVAGYGAVRVYPRVRGGTPAAPMAWLTATGLSPRARGNPPHAKASSGRVGSIPACAGEPPEEGSGASIAEVYPRVRGGTGRKYLHTQSLQGLSPRARGNHRHDDLRERGDGSIPACAGEPDDKTVHWLRAKVYPRVRGGTPLPPASECTCAGLSPRARGNPKEVLVVPAGKGSIPACAGEP